MARVSQPEKVAKPHLAPFVVRFVPLIMLGVAVPAFVMPALGFAPVASFVGLAGLGAGIATMSLGVRGGLVASVSMAVGAVLLTLTSQVWWLAGLVMALIALVYGASSRWGWQSAFIASVIALGFIASDGARSLETLERTAVVMGVSFLIWGVVVTGLARLLFRKPIIPVTEQPPRIVVGYAAMLTVVAFVTQSLAIVLDLGHTGGWLVMTPFLVILPHIKDGFRKSLQRAGGTIVGFLVVIAIGALITSDAILYAIGAALISAALYAKLRNLNYFVFALLLTPAIVILEGVSSSLTTTAEYRLEATLAAVALSLAAMAIPALIASRYPPSESD